MVDIVKESLKKRPEQEIRLLNTQGNKAARPFPNSHVPKSPRSTHLDGAEKILPSAEFIKEDPKSSREIL